MVVLLDLVQVIVVAHVPAGLIKIGLGNMLVYHARFKTDINRNVKSYYLYCWGFPLVPPRTSLTGSLRLNVVAPSSAISTESAKSKL